MGLLRIIVISTDMGKVDKKTGKQEQQYDPGDE
jgi:hypothetical protein